VDIEDLIPVEESVITFTNIGYIKRQPMELYNLQRRGGKGVSGMKQREEDFIDNLFVASSHDNILFVTNMGNMYKLRCFEIPEGSKQSRGVNIVSLLQLAENERGAALMKTADFAENQVFICISKQGKIKRTPLSAFKNLRKGGLKAVGLDEGDEIAAAFLTEGDSHVMIATRNGMAINFLETDIRSMGRSAHGVKALKLRDDDVIVGACKVYDPEMTILTVTDKGMGRRCAVTSYRVQKRGGYGMLNYKVSEEKGYVCGIRALGADDDVILINTDGIIIRIRANDIRLMGRYATGVRVMRLSDDSRVVTFTRTEHDDSQETEQVEQASEEELEEEMKEAELEEQNEVVEDSDDVTDDIEEDTEEENEEDSADENEDE
ncbi:MAG: DNA gyrase subunit A, partial [Ruminiclostridium sp.]|nr:DNA gyrase subunit A [Ruminiclostridium sp.]